MEKYFQKYNITILNFIKYKSINNLIGQIGLFLKVNTLK
jgi:hypothetical protein